MTPKDFLAIVTHMILDGQQRYIALCAAAPQKMPARDELLQIVNGAVETIVRAADEVPDAERGEALTKAATIIVNLSFARLGSVLESQFRPHPVARETAARRNLAAALQDAGLVGYTIEEVRREEDGYTVRVSKAGHMFARSDLDEAVLEDASSDTRRRLAEAARRELDRGRSPGIYAYVSTSRPGCSRCRLARLTVPSCSLARVSSMRRLAVVLGR